MKIVAIIPSRYGSTRFVAKPLAMIAGKPMIQHVFERTRRSKVIDSVCVATDDPRILKAVADFGGYAVMTSPENRTGTDRAAEAAEALGLADDDIVVNVQGDQPLLNPLCIDQLVQPFFSGIQAQMSTLAFKIVDKAEFFNPKDVKVTLNRRNEALYFSRSPIPHCRDSEMAGDAYKHLGFYAYPRWFLRVFRELSTGRLERTEKLEQLRVLEHGYRIQVVLTAYDSPEVDVPEDIRRMEALLQREGY